MERKRSIGIQIIGWFQVVSALVLLFTFNLEQNPPFNVRFGVPFIPEMVVKIGVVVFAIIIGYGYLRQLKWGYWSMLIYSIVFICISLTQASIYGGQPFVGNAIYAAIVTIYTVWNRSCFVKDYERVRKA